MAGLLPSSASGLASTAPIGRESRTADGRQRRSWPRPPTRLFQHPANASGFVVADDSAWCEHVAGGYVFTGGETVTLLARLFDSLRAESYRASESAALIEKAGALWATGGSPLTPTATAASA